MPIIDGISDIAVYDPATGTAVEITKVIANTFEFSKTDYETGETSPTGGIPYQGDSSSCSFSFLDPDGSISNQLRIWKQARTRVSFVAIGPSVAVQWYEKDHITLNSSPLGGMIKGRADRYEFSISRQGHGTHSIWRRANLLAGIGWADADSDGGADGYVQYEPGTGTSTFSFSGGEQTIEADELSGIYYDVVLPFQTVPLTLTHSVNVVTLHTVNSQYTMRYQWMNFAETSLSSVSAAKSSTGIQSQSITGNTGLTAPYKLRIWPMIMASASFGTQVGKDPSLRIGSSTTYTLS